MESHESLLNDLFNYATPLLIGIVSYFLRGILGTIRKIEKDLSQFREEYAGHKAVLQEHKERLDKIELKIEQNDRDLKLFYMEFASSTKK
jgi:chromosome segregation ATPase